MAPAAGGTARMQRTRRWCARSSPWWPAPGRRVRACRPGFPAHQAQRTRPGPAAPCCSSATSGAKIRRPPPFPSRHGLGILPGAPNRMTRACDWERSPHAAAVAASCLGARRPDAGCSALGLDRHGWRDPDPDRPGFRDRQPPSPQGTAARGRGLVDAVHRDRAGLRRAGLGGVGRRCGRGVLRRLAGRKEPVGGQPVRLRHHHDHVRGAGRLPAPGAAVRHHRRGGHARRLHRRRRRRYPVVQPYCSRWIPSRRWPA